MMDKPQEDLREDELRELIRKLQEENGLLISQNREYKQRLETTDLTLAADELKISNTLLRLFISNSPIHSFIKDVSANKSVVIQASENYVDMIGIPGSQMVGKSMEELFPPEHAAKFTADDWAVVSKGEIFRQDEDLNGRNYITIKYPIALGGKTLLAGYTIDITERKVAESALAKEKEQLHITLESIADGVVTVDTDGKIVLMNKIAEKLSGWSGEEAKGLELSKVLHFIKESTRQSWPIPIEQGSNKSLVNEMDSHRILVAKDGTERLVSCSFSSISGVQGSFLGMVLVISDISERQKMLETIQQTDRLSSLAILAGGIAHDFNNLLGGIFGYVTLARDSFIRGDKSAVEYINNALGVFNRARDLTEQLLTFSTGGSPKKKTGKLGTLLKDTASFALSGSDFVCDFSISEDLLICDFDENQLSQVINNLVLNARQSMPFGGRIKINAENVLLDQGEVFGLKKGQYIQISVSDTGMGIPKNHLKRIFEPFFTTKNQGHGLGLATCKSIIEKHDGNITVESESGKGSTFTIYLPASFSSESITPEVSKPFLGGKGTILILDDEDFMRGILDKMLQGLGFSVVVVKSGEEAVEYFKNLPKGSDIKGAILDLTIPGAMGGKEAARLIRVNWPDLPIFAVSGFSQDPVMARPTEYRFTDSLRKPFKLEELTQILGLYL